MNDQLQKIREQFDVDAKECTSMDELEALRIKYLGRKQGLVTDAFKLIGKVPPAEKGAFGKDANILKNQINSALDNMMDELKNAQSKKVDALDLTLPVQHPRVGRRHPVSEVRKTI